MLDIVSRAVYIVSRPLDLRLNFDPFLQQSIGPLPNISATLSILSLERHWALAILNVEQPSAVTWNTFHLADFFDFGVTSNYCSSTKSVQESPSPIWPEKYLRSIDAAEYIGTTRKSDEDIKSLSELTLRVSYDANLLLFLMSHRHRPLRTVGTVYASKVELSIFRSPSCIPCCGLGQQYSELLREAIQQAS
jgi:hypothetical protein